MHRPVNARQLEVLRWVSEGCPDGRWPSDDYTYKTTASALKGRGLITVKGHARSWQATITEAGTYFLEQGQYPSAESGGGSLAAQSRSKTNDHLDDVAGETVELGDKAQATLDQARALIEQIRALGGRMTVADPGEPVRAHYRRLLHACRVHHLVSTGQELRFTGRDTGDIVIAIADRSDEATSDWLRIRTTSRRITTNLDALRAGLATSSILDSISEDLRPVAADLICDLADELRKHELKLGINVRLKTPKLFLQVDTKRRDVTIEERTKAVPHVRTAAEEREARRHPWKSFPKTDEVRTGELRLAVQRDGWLRTGGSNRDQWEDSPKRPLRGQVPAIARAIKKGVIDDQNARARREQEHAEAVERHERERAEQQRAWDEQLSRARGMAAEQVRRRVFARAMEDWRTAQELRTFCDALETDAPDIEQENLRRWIAWARASAEELAPAAQASQLEDTDFSVSVTEEDVAPFMNGWSMRGPYKETTYSSPPPQQTTIPQRRPWHPGMRGRPSWWR